jgi:hypothetical protein
VGDRNHSLQGLADPTALQDLASRLESKELREGHAENINCITSSRPGSNRPSPALPRCRRVTRSCFHGKSYGWEAQILREGDLHSSRRFLLRERPAKWAEQKRVWIESEDLMSDRVQRQL